MQTKDNFHSKWGWVFCEYRFPIDVLNTYFWNEVYEFIFGLDLVFSAKDSSDDDDDDDDDKVKLRSVVWTTPAMNEGIILPASSAAL